jgi:hypothetical protein
VARHRLEVLSADTINEHHRDHRRLTAVERSALIELLYELHRVHVVVTAQRKLLERSTAREKARPKALRAK